MSDVILDFDRVNRTGLSEAIYCDGKQPEQLLGICNTCKSEKRSMLFTRLNEQQYHLLHQAHPDLLDYDPVSQTAIIAPKPIAVQQQIGVITAGSSDLPVAKEAARTLAFYQHDALQINDVGVAGLWRLNERLGQIKQCQVIICVAGFDAALPTVLAGLISAPIIAVPTSVGYGAAQQGQTALNALLVSCAPGLTVVNIDNGYGAACAALRITQQFTPV